MIGMEWTACLHFFLLAGELLVDRAEGLSLVLDVGLLGLVQMHLEQAGPVQADPAKAHNISVLGAIDH